MFITKALLFFIVGVAHAIDNDKEHIEGKSCQDLALFLESSYNQTIELLQSRSNLLLFQEDLTQLKSQLQAISKLLFHPPLNYNNKKYIISKFCYRNAAEDIAYCTALGGYLAEIDDSDEYKALQNFVLNSPPSLVLIGGSDAAVEGTWIFPRTGQPVKYFDWYKGEPNNWEGNEDCLILWKEVGALMNDVTCDMPPRFDYDRFMCELPNTF